ncbi:MAG: monofunctional biosynthetic peptidoglycan transglycosylase [Halothiobacillus sp. 35-54-62]|jgi:monofunctional biosynthetic peptidoglycan transglycosylase|nr:MAG: monofunctional biosynthetic peptidoglycan transglycosylase [Halothiobacillus sp. 35-54-62]OYY54215.1 MAG: monofunctional biosynthetic peptidoglycan transglycosylase [Halothiobacillus sp. 28-55-5]HQS02372.1 monofunctional biosynthetic peptidoglycan transglycosylase [Halothiobacillus sp.]HQS29756.1 monofunctional biosynthetic peptidoglycan transglycosylase [Halothiobacillus sp.]HUN00953.1 monofunctional biosynthetic peptidoglycan transglycosylase [Halothiobacillus sp.]
MKPRNPLRRLLLLLFWLVLAAFLAVQAWFFVQVWQLRSHNPQTTAFMRERLALVRAVNPHAQLNYQWVNYRDMAPIAKRAVVASEDDRFMDHLGFDWTGIQEAFEKNLADGEFAAGGSTISQQLARNLFLSPSKNLLRKGQEALITVMLETTLGKRRILELYLNVAEWGDLLYGIGAASRYYFHKPPSALSPHEAAMLAAMLPNPRFYQANPASRGLQKRIRAVESRMNASRIP